MSFILDALRRAQNANQHATTDSAPIYADRVPDAPADLRQRVWLGTGVALLLLSVALIAWWLGRESAAPPAAAITTPAPAPTPTKRIAPRPVAANDRAPVRALDQEAARGRPAQAPPAAQTEAPARRSVTPGTVTIMPSEQSAPRTAQAPRSDTSPSTAELAGLPQYESLLLDGKINLPNLQMDMLVYNREPTKRFVFINFKKYREGDTLDRKTAIEEITTQGAVLNHSGERFLLQPN